MHAVDEDQQTALHIAVSGDSRDQDDKFLRLLLDHHCHVDAADSEVSHNHLFALYASTFPILYFPFKRCELQSSSSPQSHRAGQPCTTALTKGGCPRHASSWPLERRPSSSQCTVLRPWTWPTGAPQPSTTRSKCDICSYLSI